MAAATPTTIKYNQCVSERLIPFKPLKLKAAQCQIHRSRANCLAMKPCLNDDNENYTSCVSHVTVLENVYLDNNLKPYYLCMIDDDDDDDGDDDDDVSEDDGDESGGMIAELKLIDFAHAHWTPGLGPDQNVLQGVRSVEKLLAELV